MKIGRRTAIAVLAGIAGLATAQIGSYWLLAQNSMPLVAVPHRMVSSPEFICVDRRTWRPLTEPQRAALERALLLKAPKLYHSMLEVPKEQTSFRATTPKDAASYDDAIKRGYSPELLEDWRLAIEAGREVTSLKGGVRIHWALKRKGLFWMRSSSGEWISTTGAEGRDELHLWVLGFWVKVWTYGVVAA